MIAYAVEGPSRMLADDSVAEMPWAVAVGESFSTSIGEGKASTAPVEVPGQAQ